MKKTLCNAILGLLAMTGSAMAQTTSFLHTVGLSAEVPKVCSFDGAISADGAFIAAVGQDPVFTVQVDSSTKVVDSRGSITFADAFCNTASDVTLSRTFDKLTNGQNAVVGFESSIYYNVKLDWGSQNNAILLSEDFVDDGETELGPINGDIVIEIHAQSTPGQRLLPGQYTDTLTLSVVPQE